MADDAPDSIILEPESMEESIRVCTRMRPLFPKEAVTSGFGDAIVVGVISQVEAGHIKAWKVEQKSMQLIVEPPTQAEIEESRQGKTSSKKSVEKTQAQKDQVQRYYAFDRCFDDDAENDEVFAYVARDIVLDAFKGINGCVFAYGQTGSGKTHSIMGVAEDPGILPRSLAEFFDCMSDSSLLREEMEDAAAEKEDEMGEEQLATKDHRTEGLEDGENREYLMRVSYVEIYLERVNDLLQEGPRGGAVENLDVKEDPKKGFVVVGLHEEAVASMEEVMTLLSKAEQRRHFARTNFNETSSRSHVVFSITLESTSTFEDGTNVSRRGELKIVDLAGNEKAGRASEGVENAKLVLEEGKAINKSLFLLSEVISKLSKQAQQGEDKTKKKGEKDVYIPWRDSKLTRLLQKALGGNSRAAVLVAVHPSSLYLDTSFSTLRFAMKCKEIKKKVCANFFSPEQSLIAQQKKLIAMLHAQLREISEGGVTPGISSQRNAENDEQIRILKSDLENKVAKFQQFIIKATASPTQAPSGGDLQRARTMRQPSTFRRMETLAAARYGLRDIDGLNQADSEDPAVRTSMTHALSLLDRFGQDLKNDTYGSLQSFSSGDAPGGVLRFETLEHSIEGAIHELECIDDNPLSAEEESLSCEDSSASESSDHEAPQEAQAEGGGLFEPPPDQAAGEQKPKQTKSAVSTGKPKSVKVRVEKKHKAKTTRASKKGKASAPSKQPSEILASELPAATPAPEEHLEQERENNEARKIKALVLKQRAERENWASRLRKAKEMGLEVISKVLFRMQDEKEALVKCKKRTAELTSQIRHICALMHRLGLSVLSTASAPAKGQDSLLAPRDQENESLKAFLDRVREKRDAEPLKLSLSVGDPVGQSAKARGFPDIDQIRPLACAAISNALSRVMMAEVLENMEEDGDNGATEGKINGALQPPLMALAASVVSSGASPTPNEEGTTPRTPQNENEAISALELIFSKAANADNNKGTADTETAKMIESKKEQTVESILQILPPWEQHMLALLYEQQEMRKALGQLRDHFVERLKELQVSVKKGLLEKIELTEHCDRMLAALWSFKAELTDSKSRHRVDEDTNAKFAKLMAKLEELSIRLAEREIDYKLLSEDYATLKEENATLLETTRRLKEENLSLLMIPRTLANWEDFKGYDDVEKRGLARDVHMLQGYVSHLRMCLEEGRAVELDVRRLNQALYMELLAANTTIADLQDQIKFHTSVDRREAKMVEEQLAAANQAEAEKSDRIRELEEQVSNLKEQLAAAVAKSETEDREAEPPVESKDQTADAEQQALTKRSGKKNTASAKAKTKTKAATKGPSVVVSQPPASSPAKSKQVGKRNPTAAPAGVDRLSVKRLPRAPSSAPSRASLASAKPEKPISARGGEGSRLVRVVEPEDHSSSALSPKVNSLQPPVLATKQVLTNPSIDKPPTAIEASRTSVEALTTAAGRAPAFTGDPRNKGLTNMVAALSGRRRKGSAAQI
ncbi:kinesin heavy chain, putative [Eimeria necatrix]|uniref:Kinesin heavy chain, putative n=1 Tax=Eimeria necatrix TaxID=51315 RepID=U6MS35_9EIME|nr:kinesin heavy chain, putative [Eimeria necatrix]CDJ64465.1 kinesin heavy chain, putative [Eimeria necatrix]